MEKFNMGDRVVYLGGDGEVFYVDPGTHGTVTEEYPFPNSKAIVGVTFDTATDLRGNPLLQFVDEDFLTKE